MAKGDSLQALQQLIVNGNKLEAVRMCTRLQAAEAQQVGMIFDFCGYLTTLPKHKAVTFSGVHDSSVAVTVIKEWAKLRGITAEMLSGKAS